MASRRQRDGAAPRSKTRASTEPSIFIFGAGKVGAGLARELRKTGCSVTLRAQRAGLPTRRIDADVVIVAVRDRDVAPTAEALVKDGLIGHRKVAVVHCAGALGPEALAAARGPNVSVAQMHPMISFAAKDATPTLTRGQLHVDGDPAAMKAARALGKRLGMTARTIPGLDRVAYHAAAGLVANGAAALAAGGVELLEKAGVSRETAAAMLGPLLRSVAENVERLGLPDALTGPVRRGDAAGIGRHIDVLHKLVPSLVPFFIAAARTQLPLARALGDAPAEGFDAIEKKLDEAQRTLA
ncbi:Ketopantoate reductase PanG [Minicystis rosea]|nr:Ketopantoate reductase PanG [Minicystis rosea]